MITRRRLFGMLAALPLVSKVAQAVEPKFTHQSYGVPISAETREYVRRQLAEWQSGAVRTVGEMLPGVRYGYDLDKQLFVPVKSFKVETLEHDPKLGSYYKTRWDFASEEEAIAFVKSLIPEISLISLEKVQGPIDHERQVIRSGHRGAIRYMVEGQQHIVNYCMKIVSKDNSKDYTISDFPLWDLSRAWACLESIRVNGKPVSRGKNIPEYITQPFRRGNPVIEYVTNEMHTPTNSERISFAMPAATKKINMFRKVDE